ncbi:hypothetical protein AAY473_030848 [Plecturocebus cupreus]
MYFWCQLPEGKEHMVYALSLRLKHGGMIIVHCHLEFLSSRDPPTPASQNSAFLHLLNQLALTHWIFSLKCFIVGWVQRLTPVTLALWEAKEHNELNKGRKREQDSQQRNRQSSTHNCRMKMEGGGWVLWLTSVIPAFWEAKAGRSPEKLKTSLGNIAKPCFYKNKIKKKEQTRPGTVAHAYNASTLGGQGVLATIFMAGEERTGDSRQRSPTGHQRDSFGWHGYFVGVPARRFLVQRFSMWSFSVRSIWDRLDWSRPHKENSNWKR